MFAAVHIPRPALQALFIGQPDKRYQPVVVLDDPEKTSTSKKDRGKLRVLEISDEAEEFGIHRGMTAVQAQARCHYLILLNRSLLAESQLTETLLDIAEQFTPDFEDTDCGICLLDLGGVAAIEEEAIQVARLLHERITDKEYSPRIGIAANPDLALLAARACDFLKEPDSGNILVLRDKDISPVLSPLPISLLNPEPAMADIFDLWGIHQIAQFTRLSRADIVERLGEETGEMWDRAMGQSRRLLRLVRPVAEYAAETELEYEVTTIEPLVFLMRRLLETIAARLRGAYLVASRLCLRLDLADGNLYQRTFRIPEPCADVDILTSMLQVHLESYEARAPITGFSLRAVPARAGRHQFDLFAAGVKDPNRLSETLARAEAILGGERFGVPRLLATHHPDRFEMRPFRPEKEPEAMTDSKMLGMKRLPMRKLRPRRHVQVEVDGTGYRQPGYTVPYTVPNSVPSGNEPPVSAPAVITSGDFKGRLSDVRGPYFISGNWWEKLTYWKREEWDVEHENGRFYRLAKEKGEWFVEAMG